MKKLLYAVPLFTLVLTQSVQAISIKQDLQNLKQDRKELRQDIKQTRQDIKQEIKASVSGKLKAAAKIIGGTVSAVSGSTLTVTKDGKSYTVTTDSSTTLRRRFWGGSTLSEFVVGNMVNVWGKFTDDAQTTIQARLIRNLSIQKRNGVFFGTIVSKTDTTFVVQTVNRGNQTVTVGSAKLLDRKGTAITYSQIVVGHKVRISGMWDRSANTITETTHIRDFSLPAVTTPTAVPTQ